MKDVIKAFMPSCLSTWNTATFNYPKVFLTYTLTQRCSVLNPSQARSMRTNQRWKVQVCLQATQEKKPTSTDHRDHFHIPSRATHQTQHSRYSTGVINQSRVKRDMHEMCTEGFLDTSQNNTATWSGLLLQCTGCCSYINLCSLMRTKKSCRHNMNKSMDHRS